MRMISYKFLAGCIFSFSFVFLFFSFGILNAQGSDSLSYCADCTWGGWSCNGNYRVRSCGTRENHEFCAHGCASGTCNAAPDCNTTSKEWTVGTNTCTASFFKAYNNTVRAATDSSEPTTGTAEFRCGSSGSWTLQSGATCNASCSATSVTFTAGSYSCPAELPSRPHGSTYTATATVAQCTISASPASYPPASYPPSGYPPASYPPVPNTCLNTNINYYSCHDSCPFGWRVSAARTCGSQSSKTCCWRSKS